MAGARRTRKASTATEKPAAAKPNKEKGAKAGKAPPPEAKPSEKVASQSRACPRTRASRDTRRSITSHGTARVVDGVSHPDSELMDVTTKDGDLVEVKTMTVGTDDKLTMNSYAQCKAVKEKECWQAASHRRFG